MTDGERTAFVLSGGASLGAIQVGMLQALYEHDIVPDLVLGSSVGAINGSFIASRPTTVATASELAAVWSGMRRSVVFPANPVTGLLGLVGKRDSLFPGSGLERTVREHLQFERLEDATIPLHVTTTDVLTGEAVRLSRGDALDAVMASAAVPGVLPAVTCDGRALTDGGVADNTPLSHAVELGATTIYVLPAGSSCALTEPPRGALACAIQAITVLIRRRLLEDIAQHAGDARIVVLPPPCPLRVAPTDFSRSDELVSRALAGARVHLAGDATAPLAADHPLQTHGHGREEDRAGDAAGPADDGTGADRQLGRTSRRPPSPRCA